MIFKILAIAMVTFAASPNKHANQPADTTVLWKMQISKLRIMAQANNKAASLVLGVLSFYGIGTQANDSASLSYLIKSDTSSSPIGKYYVGALILRNRIDGNKSDARNMIESSMSGIKELAKNGNAIAQNIIGINYYFGNFIEKNIDSSRKWLKLSANQGYQDAQNNIGNIIAEYDSNSSNDTMAAGWYKKASDGGYITASINLAACYSEGKCAQKDVNKAIAILEPIASPDAKFALGYLYLINPDALDRSKGLDLITNAAKEGNAVAQYTLGVLYYKGQHLPKDADKSIYWYTKAAAQGYADAQYNLGVIEYLGLGTIQNKEEGKKWIQKAQEQGVGTSFDFK